MPSSTALPALRLARARSARIEAIDMGDEVAGTTAPLSFAQEALWFHDRLTGPSGIHNIAMAARLHGTLRIDVLERSLRALAIRHEALRTSFHQQDEGAVQRVDPEATPDLPVEDLEAVTPGLREETLQHRLRQQASAAFDLTRAPLMRARLYRFAPDEHVLLMVVHHIVADDWSRAIIARDLGTIYRAFESGTEPELPTLPLQYGRFALWQRRQVDGDTVRKSLDYWKSRLDGIAPVELPHDRPRPARPDGRGGRVEFELSSVTLTKLEAIAQSAGVTLYMTLLAAFEVLLMRYSGQSDISVGTPIEGRTRLGLDDLAGYFVNMLVMRTDLSGDPHFDELLARVRETCLGAYEHQDVPFEVLVRHVAPERALDRNPLFQVSFALQNTPHRTLEIGAVPARLESIHTDAARFDLSLTMTEYDGGVKADLEYSVDLFDHATIERMAGHFGNLIEGIVGNPRARLSALPLMAPQELHRILVQWNDTARDYRLDRALHEIFEEQAARNPSACAVVFEDRMLDYAGLDAHANRLAHHLRARGIGPDVLVGVCMPRCPELVVAILAVLKAGGAFLPIDPDYPEERIAFVLEDSAAPVVLTIESALGRLPSARHQHAIALDSSHWLGLAQNLPTHRLAPLAGPDHLAYVIYTSGSTGRPKGAAVPHRGFCNHVLWIIECIGLSAADRLLQKTTISFDASLWEFLAPLAIGAPVILARPGGERDMQYLVQVIREQRITILQMVPSALRVLLGERSISACDSLRYVNCGGEALDWELASEFARCLPAARLGNFYGPSEASDNVTHVDVTELSPGSGQVPIGRPIANTRAYVLDTHRQPVPIGVAGELYIGGVGLARGYLNRPELTAERFVDDPFTPGERLYRTGDLVHWRPDGLIGFIGRTDHQVKFRGFRIELGEIESALNACDGVRNSAVVVREDQRGTRRLVAYVEGERLEPAALRAELKSRLPDYMVPELVVPLPHLPLLPNDKLDRKALPAPDWSARQSSQQEPPQGPTEQMLAEIWSHVLGVSGIGRHDNFFELGGHSLLVVTMVQAALRRNLTIGVGAVFAHPTVAALAASIPGMSNEAAPVTVPAVPDNLIPRDCTAITPAMLPLVELSQPDIDRIVATVPGGAANIQDVYPLAPLQEGILYHHQLDTEGDAYLIRRILAFDSRARLDEFLRALQVVIDRHDSLRTAVVWDGLLQPVQVVYRRAPLPVQWLDLNTGEDPREVLEVHSDPTRLRFALTQAPLMRAFAVQEQGGEACHLALVDHHIIADHASADLITEETRALLEGRGGTLEEPVQFRSFVAQVRAATYEAYFRRLLGDLAEPTLPFGLADTRVDPTRIRESRDSLSAALAERIRSAANSRGVSAAVLFHVAWAMVLARCSKQEDVVFGTVLLGRSQGLHGIDRVIGLCMNTLPVRLRLGSASAEAVVADTYRQLGELIEHEQAPLALAQRCSAVPAPSPLFSALLNYRHSLPDPIPSNGGGPAFLLPGIQLLDDQERTNYPIYAAVDDVGTGFSITAQCIAGIDPRRLVDYLIVAVGALVDALDRSPQTPVRSLDLLPGPERELLLGTWNETAADYPREQTVAQLFEVQVARRPDAVAVTVDGESLSYRELNARANALAVHLRALGVRPGVLVGLCVERSPAMMVGLLATLKAGGTYVPLDPAFPAQRLAFMLEDSQASVLLTQTNLAGLLPVDAVQVVNLDRLAPGDLADGEDLPSVAGPDDLAYVLYTSGSTGKPKGVEITHRALTNFLWSMRTQPGCDERDVLLALTTLSFDIAGLELYLPLITGARVELVSRETATDGQLLRERIEQVNPTLLQATPATWRMLIDAGWTGHQGLTALIGGEPLPPELVQPLLERTKALWNLYGPTETTIWSSVKRVTSATEQITVGRPIANTTFYIVDKALQPVPVGVAGELLIGGDGLARGYRGRPELTAEKFIAHPFSDEAGARVYRTGDLARYRADGEVVHLGRMDHQVKIRGFRIELGEIEAALAACAGVAQAVVDVRADHAGTAALAAYVVPVAGQSVSGAELRQVLRQTLPDYMVPQYFVQIQALPLTPNGKIDRKALPAPAALVPQALGDSRAAQLQTPSERLVAGVWSELLGVETIGPEDNFFDLGGHSLLAMQAIGRIEKLTGTRFSAQRFAFESLAQLAHQLETAAPKPGRRTGIVARLLGRLGRT